MSKQKLIDKWKKQLSDVVYSMDYHTDARVHYEESGRGGGVYWVFHNEMLVQCGKERDIIVEFIADLETL